MKFLFATEFSILAVSSLLVGCQASEQSTEKKEKTSESQTEVSENDHDHDHIHELDEEAKKIYEGYFEDSQVTDRSLSDWESDWQSVYPYLQDGTLDEVFAYKTEQDDSMTVGEYKEYYNKGIKQNKSDHYHLYWGDNRKALLNEVTNWPTYYPSNLDGHDIAHEMMEH